MRKILFLVTLLVIIILGLSSCSKDEAVIDINQLEGVWGLVSENEYYYDEGGESPIMKTTILLNQLPTVKNHNSKK